MKLTKATLIMILLIVTALFNSCSAHLEWYVRNFSDQHVYLTLRYDSKNINFQKNFLPINSKFIYYKDKIVDINHDTKNILDDRLALIAVDSSTYQMSIPPKSTVELTYIIPTDYGHSGRNVAAEFNQNGKIYTIDSKSAFDKNSPLKTTGGLTLKNLVYYDYGRVGK